MAAQIAFRTDASLSIGTGHVMRCLTLANALRESGADCRFVCREHPGNLLHLIREQGFEAVALPSKSSEGGYPKTAVQPDLAHSEWLGADWKTDADATREALAGVKFDWLVVDHYALDARWETGMRPHCRKLLVIDDLADRKHDCDLLLDQTYGREQKEYLGLLPVGCKTLLGSNYALLRPDFAALRPYSLSRREIPALTRLLVFMGGVDRTNATAHVLQALSAFCLPEHCRITVVLGSGAPFIDLIRKKVKEMSRPTELLVNVDNMAEIMAEADLAIGAAGSTSWERCCLGLPTIAISLAENQEIGLAALKNAGAAVCVSVKDSLDESLCGALDYLLADPSRLRECGARAAALIDGHGASRVSAVMKNTH